MMLPLVIKSTKPPVSLAPQLEAACVAGRLPPLLGTDGRPLLELDTLKAEMMIPLLPASFKARS
ncbi:MAG: hypothetical protein JO002_03790 [Burkholderiaceae bacterium]|nr:hypothetical protein [Burkholderiaceae bacterium]